MGRWLAFWSEPIAVTKKKGRQKLVSFSVFLSPCLLSMSSFKSLLVWAGEQIMLWEGRKEACFLVMAAEAMTIGSKYSFSFGNSTWMSSEGSEGGYEDSQGWFLVLYASAPELHNLRTRSPSQSQEHERTHNHSSGCILIIQHVGCKGVTWCLLVGFWPIPQAEESPESLDTAPLTGTGCSEIPSYGFIWLLFWFWIRTYISNIDCKLHFVWDLIKAESI